MPVVPRVSSGIPLTALEKAGEGAGGDLNRSAPVCRSPTLSPGRAPGGALDMIEQLELPPLADMPVPKGVSFCFTLVGSKKANCKRLCQSLYKLADTEGTANSILRTLSH